MFEELTSVHVDQLIGSMARGIAQAQYDLDANGVRIAQLMAGADPKDRVAFGKATYSLLELGFTPTFYQFVDTLLEVKVSISMSRETSTAGNSTSSSSSKSASLFGTPNIVASVASVSASYASKYQYSAEGSSLMRTKLVPVPAPAVLQERIQAMIADEQRRAEESP